MTDDAVEVIVAQGYREEFGVRHLRRAEQSLMEAPMSRLILSGELTDWPEVEVVVCNGQIVLQRKEELALAEAPRAYCLPRAAKSAPWKLEPSKLRPARSGGDLSSTVVAERWLDFPQCQSRRG